MAEAMFFGMMLALVLSFGRDKYPAAKRALLGLTKGKKDMKRILRGLWNCMVTSGGAMQGINLAPVSRNPAKPLSPYQDAVLQLTKLVGLVVCLWLIMALIDRIFLGHSWLLPHF